MIELYDLNKQICFYEFVELKKCELDIVVSEHLLDGHQVTYTTLSSDFHAKVYLYRVTNMIEHEMTLV
jgi:hypothetical protein